MHRLAAQLTTLTAAAAAHVHAATTTRREDEEGSVTIENVLWAIAMIAIVGIVVTAITSYVTSKAGEIK
jgi:heme/copper-type cytochrome/quinol oxidase subunit 2